MLGLTGRLYVRTLHGSAHTLCVVVDWLWSMMVFTLSHRPSHPYADDGLLLHASFCNLGCCWSYTLWHNCSAELDILGEITTLAVKVMKDTADFAMMDAEIEALAVVRGKPRFIQDEAKYHRVEDEDSPLLIVTRYANQAGNRSSSNSVATFCVDT